MRCIAVAKSRDGIHSVLAQPSLLSIEHHRVICTIGESPMETCSCNANVKLYVASMDGDWLHVLCIGDGYINRRLLQLLSL